MSEHRIIIEKQATNGIATASLFLGLFGAFIVLIPLIGWFALPIPISAIILGLVGLVRKTNRASALVGISLGVAIIIYKITFWFWLM